MKGKIIFVTGAAVGYVLGTRAGRKRYEQIKSGAICIWNSKPVQNGVDQAKGLVADTVGDVPQQIITAGRRAVAKMIGPEETAKPSASNRAADGSKASSTSSASSSTATAAKPATKRPAAKKSAAKKPAATKPAATKPAATKSTSGD